MVTTGARALPGRVLIVGKGAPDRGGIAAYLRFMQGSALQQRWQLRLLNLAHADERQGGRLSVANVRRTLDDTRGVWRASAGRDVVHIHSALAPGVTLVRAGLLALAGRARGARVVVHAHGGRVPLWMTTRRRRAVARVALRPADRLIAVSEGGRAALAATVGRRVVRVDNGVDVHAFMARPSHHEAPLRILYVGLLTPRKGVLDLLDASALLHRRGIPHQLRLVGGTPDEGGTAESEVRAAAEAAGAHVELTGIVEPEAMAEVYGDADVFCLPSWWEAMPLSLLEAMATGLPVVASSVGDIPRIVEHGVSGMLVPANDAGALAEALATLLGDGDARARMGAAARERVRTRFSSERTVAAIDDIYRSLCGAGR
jgi:glycosyltransferase involved in cell wall biosynthesis